MVRLAKARIGWAGESGFVRVRRGRCGEVWQAGRGWFRRVKPRRVEVRHGLAGEDGQVWLCEAGRAVVWQAWHVPARFVKARKERRGRRVMLWLGDARLGEVWNGKDVYQNGGKMWYTNGKSQFTRFLRRQQAKNWNASQVYTES